MENLFYSASEQCLFYIPDRYIHGQGTLDSLIKNLEEAKEFMRKYAPEGEIYCEEIRKSSAYKYMWYFKVFSNICPKEAFKLGNEWTFHSWIEH